MILFVNLWSSQKEKTPKNYFHLPTITLTYKTYHIDINAGHTSKMWYVQETDKNTQKAMKRKNNDEKRKKTNKERFFYENKLMQLNRLANGMRKYHCEAWFRTLAYLTCYRTSSGHCFRFNFFRSWHFMTFWSGHSSS